MLYPHVRGGRLVEEEEELVLVMREINDEEDSKEARMQYRAVKLLPATT